MPGPFRFVPPELPTAAQTRPRLLRTLIGRFAHRCTVIVAGAGHGKTTLLVQAAAENRLAPRGDDVWLTLEVTDADASASIHRPASVTARLVGGWRRSPGRAA